MIRVLLLLALVVAIAVGEPAQQAPAANPVATHPIVTRIVLVEPTQKVGRATKVPAMSTFMIYGANFGSIGDHISVTIGSYPCAPVTRTSTTQLSCIVRGGKGTNQGAVVTVNGVSSPVLLAAGTGSAITPRIDFPNIMSDGLSCVPPYGSADSYDNTRCNCWSGAASSDKKLNTDCDDHVSCAAYTSSSSIVAQYPPTRPITSFANDTFYVTQTMPIVRNRRDTVIQFAIPNIASPSVATAPGTYGSEGCYYPGNLWTKSIDNLDCIEQFHGAIPWSQHGMCGFIEDKATANALAHVRVFRSNLLTTFTETYKNVKGEMTFRTVVHTFAVAVSFQIRMTAVSTTLSTYIADEDDKPSLTVEVSGDALYDVASKKTLISFDTTMVWPYSIAMNTLTPVYAIATGNLEAKPIAASAEQSAATADMLCDSTQDSDCEQSWLLTINTEPNNPSPGPACNIAGTYTFNTQALMCRDLSSGAAQACPGNPDTTFVITVGKTDLCDTNTKNVDATAGLKVTIDPFFDIDHLEPQSIFQTGDMIYLRVRVNNPLATLDRIVFNTISVEHPDGTNPTVLYRVAGSLPAVNLFTTTNFNVTTELSEESDIAPGTDAVLYFQFKLTRAVIAALSTLTSTNQLSQTLQITVTVDLYYHGNNKRETATVEAVPAIGHSHISFYENDDVDNAEADDKPLEGVADEASNLFDGSASTLPVAAVAGVVALVLLM